MDDPSIPQKKKEMFSQPSRESLYHSLFEQATDAIMVTDLNGNFIEVNESFCQMFGYTREEIYQLSVIDIVEKEDLLNQPLKYDLLKEGIHVFSERKMVRKDGSIFTVEANIKICEDNYVLAIARDVTERNNVKRAIEKEKALSDSIINMLPGIFFLRYHPGNYIRWNKNLEEVTGYSTRQVLNSPILSFIADKDREAVGKKVEEAMLYGYAETEACVITKTGEQVPYYFSTVSIMLDGRPAIMGSAIDISGRIKALKELEEEKLKKQQEITEAMITAAENERQSIGRELHDNINQLLAGSLIYLRLYLVKLKKNDKLLEESALQIMNAISEIRNLSHSIVSPFVEEQPFTEAIAKITGILETSGIKDIKFDLKNFNENKISIKLKITIYRILQEQFNNILKHAHASSVFVRINQEGSDLQMFIKDNGVGFDTEAKPGGIGIINIKTRASLFNGKVIIKSAPGTGCELMVEFKNAQ